MQGKIEGIQKSIDFIEKNLTRELDIEDIASIAVLSPSYYQHIFGALCGMTVGEYIRARRMSLATQDLRREDVKVIDIANRYCYDSPDSFAKTFQKYHGITPSQAREAGASLKSFAPLHIKMTMEGGTMLDYRIVEKSSFTFFALGDVSILIQVIRIYQSSGMNIKKWERIVQLKEHLEFALMLVEKIQTIGLLIYMNLGMTFLKNAKLIRSLKVFGRNLFAKDNQRTICRILIQEFGLNGYHL